jgi:hypothetical protein
MRPFQQAHLTCWHGRGATAYVIKMHRDRFVRDIGAASLAGPGVAFGPQVSEFSTFIPPRAVTCTPFTPHPHSGTLPLQRSPFRYIHPSLTTRLWSLQRHPHRHGFCLLSAQPPRRLCSTHATHLQQHPTPSFCRLLRTTLSACFSCNQTHPSIAIHLSCRISRSLRFFPTREDLVKASASHSSLHNSPPGNRA